MARRRRGESLAEMLLTMPWQVSMVVAAIVYVGVKWILPSMWASSIFLKPVAEGLAGMAWMFSGAFVLIGLVAFAIQRATAGKAESASGGSTGKVLIQPRSRSQIASDRSPMQERREPTVAEPRDSTPQALPAATQAQTPSLPKPTDWSLELIRDIEWKRFEDLCQKFYAIKGIRSETTALGPDGGIDIRLYQDDSGRATSIVQCKAWGERFVGVKPVRELLGVMTHEKIGKAFFMTSGRFSDDAREVAQSNRITLIDGQMLLMMIKRLPADSQAVLLAFATAGDYLTPTCPSCGVTMRAVEGKEGRPDFWGCVQFPRCRQKLGMRRASQWADTRTAA